MVALRPWRRTDVPALFKAFSDPVTQRFSWASTTTYEEANALGFVVERERARLRGDEVALALVEPHDEQAVLGGGSLYDVDRTQGRASVGYWLAPEARGRGVATHAVRLLASWAFAELGIARLELTCGPDNLGSQRVAARCGFRREGLLRSHLPFQGERRDTVVFGLLPGELQDPAADPG